ncbi:deleted in malignant brain tumors 1 protein-like [Ostrea edulis]|uniref:deleted in malignant brain tumors 1 protein-like n=1 Tax=Ostrea edulis TaxID=37623 RepID=UPI0024AEBE73|nr:deleted in malignant brain tumors 1 protein-like [Ostrea edulis]
MVSGVQYVALVLMTEKPGSSVECWDIPMQGNEQTINECHQNGWGNAEARDYYRCRHNYDASVYCVRLVDGDNKWTGRLEVFYNGSWGTVCDDWFGDREAEVICRMLGYNEGGWAFANAVFGKGEEEIWLDNLRCLGNESDVYECPSHDWASHDCTHEEDVSISCKTPVIHSNTTEGIRLTGGHNALAGRVEIRHNGHWGTYCDRHFDDREAEVICRMLGHENSGSLVLCIFEAIRLVNGENNYTGRVEVFHNGAWGTVCDDSFDRREASVLCRMLGYHNGGWAFNKAQYGQGLERIWIDNLECYGNETDISQCKSSTWGVSNCNHYEDAAISCDINPDTNRTEEQKNRRTEVTV